ncbi:hypothetical protein IWZ00DRAFT_441344 [Phyllosticta capitalensis]
MEARFHRPAALLIISLVALFLWFRSSPPFPNKTPLAHGSQPAFSSGLNYTRLQPANSTLGVCTLPCLLDCHRIPLTFRQFGAVVAISRANSPRQEHLLFAGNLTGIDITIPHQPKWSEDDISKFKAEKDSRITRGSAMAWLGHLNALRWFLDSRHETVIILEDDVDWDIHLRTVQVPLVSENFQRLTSSRDTYWGDLTKWEILYLGHCGDFFSVDDWEKLQHTTFPDDTLLPRSRMHTRTRELLESLDIYEGYRMLHRSKWPLCTFGYAVNRASARRILEELAPKETEGGCQAYDVRILEGCRDLDYKCYSANPELFHHIQAPSEITNANDGTDDAGRIERTGVVTTTNIACSARSDSFFTKDPATLKYLQQEIGEKGHCLVDHMEEDAKKPF